mmetsp:Transcript_1655/g.5879  ORF Transcript_1655/g.5879 Transcript_1655/m.5879 type:complete len:243 (+) Transcript_1655:681-1409(+)
MASAATPSCTFLFSHFRSPTCCSASSSAFSASCSCWVSSAMRFLLGTSLVFSSFCVCSSSPSRLSRASLTFLSWAFVEPSSLCAVWCFSCSSDSSVRRESFSRRRAWFLLRVSLASFSCPLYFSWLNSCASTSSMRLLFDSAAASSCSFTISIRERRVLYSGEEVTSPLAPTESPSRSPLPSARSTMARSWPLLSSSSWILLPRYSISVLRACTLSLSSSFSFSSRWLFSTTCWPSWAALVS